MLDLVVYLSEYNVYQLDKINHHKELVAFHVHSCRLKPQDQICSKWGCVFAV
jgi:hypothetical protein